MSLLPVTPSFLVYIYRSVAICKTCEKTPQDELISCFKRESNMVAREVEAYVTRFGKVLLLPCENSAHEEERKK